MQMDRVKFTNLLETLMLLTINNNNQIHELLMRDRKRTIPPVCNHSVSPDWDPPGRH